MNRFAKFVTTPWSLRRANGTTSSTGLALAMRHCAERLKRCWQTKGVVENFLGAHALAVAAEQLAEGLGEEKTTLPFNDRQTNDAKSSPPELRAEAFATGAMLGGRYLVEGKMDEGGIGLVFLARDQKLHRAPVVIKVLREDLRHKVWFEKKFKQEIAALAAAHSQGVIHRDLKPENIMLQTAGDEEYVKLIDFGIATVRETAEAEGRTTAVIGTRDYVAPEQLRGKPVAASDTYALGVVAYEMVTGRRPFNSDSLAELVDLQRDGVKVKPCDLRPGLPLAAQDAILQALSFAPQDRYATVKEFTDALARALTGESARASPVSLTFASRTRWLLMAVMIVVGVISIIALWRRNTWNTVKSEPAQTAPIASPKPTQTAPIASPKPTQTALFFSFPELHLSYSLVARRDPKRYPNSRPFPTFDNVIFGAGDKFRFYISSPQSGYLYIINKGPYQSDGLPEFNVLFPHTDTNGGSAGIRAGQVVQLPLPSQNPQQDWLVFDRKKGVEIIWLVWSEQDVPEIKAINGRASPKDLGAMRNSKERASVLSYLARPSATKPEIERDKASKQTRLEGFGRMLIWKVMLERR